MEQIKKYISEDCFSGINEWGLCLIFHKQQIFFGQTSDYFPPQWSHFLRPAVKTLWALWKWSEDRRIKICWSHVFIILLTSFWLLSSSWFLIIFYPSPPDLFCSSTCGLLAAKPHPLKACLVLKVIYKQVLFFSCELLIYDLNYFFK